MQRVRDNLATIIAAIAVAAAVVAAFALLGPWRGASDQELLAVIHDSAGNVRTLPLAEDARVEVTTELGSNTVLIEHGAAHMAAADCAGGDCMRQQSITHPGQQLICLPHRLWVEVVAGDDAQDGRSYGEMDVDAVTWDDANDDVDLVTR